MRESAAVSAGLGAFYQAFNTHDPDQFGAAVSLGPGVSVIGSAPGEGHQSRDSWLKAYTEGVAAAGLRLEDERWKVVHLHFSVGTPDEDALQPAP